MKDSISGTVIPCPSVSDGGYLVSVGEKLDRLLAYYFTSDFNQSEIFADRVVSYPHTLSLYQKDPDNCCSVVQREIEYYLKRYFKIVNVEVSYKDVVPNSNAGQYTMIIDVIAGDTLDEQQRLYKHIGTSEGVIQDIFTYNNEGVQLKHDYNAKRDGRNSARQ